MIYQSSKKRHDSYVQSNNSLKKDRSLSQHSIYQIDEEIQEEDENEESRKNGNT